MKAFLLLISSTYLCTRGCVSWPWHFLAWWEHLSDHAHSSVRLISLESLDQRGQSESETLFHWDLHWWLTQFNRYFSSLCRSVILRLVSLIVLILTLWRQVTCNGNINSDDCKLCNYNHKLYPVILLIDFIWFSGESHSCLTSILACLFEQRVSGSGFSLGLP